MAGFFETASDYFSGGSSSWSDVTKSANTGMQEMNTSLKKAGEGASAASGIVGIAGAINSAIGAYYAAQNAQYQLESQQETLKFQAEMSKINQRAAEFSAQNMMMAGQRQAGAVSMKYGQAKGASRARMAAAGGVIGEGSFREIEATTDLMKEIDMITINANTVRAAEAMRTQAVNYGNQATLLNASAANTGLMLGTISPVFQAGTSLLGSASNLATTFGSISKEK